MPNCSSPLSMMAIDHHSQTRIARNTVCEIANPVPPVPAADPAKTAIAAVANIWANVTDRVRASPRPCASWYVTPLNQPIQIIANRAANSPTDCHEMWCASVDASLAIKTT